MKKLRLLFSSIHSSLPPRKQQYQSGWSLSMGRVWHQMVQWNTDSALIIGGQIDGIGFVATPTCEWFDLKQLSAHQAPQMNEERAFFAAVKLSPNPSRYIIAAIAGTRSTNRNTPTIEVLMNGCITSHSPSPDRQPSATATPSHSRLPTALLNTCGQPVRTRRASGSPSPVRTRSPQPIPPDAQPPTPSPSP